MRDRLQGKRVQILTSLAEYRCLSVPQLAALHFTSLQTARTARRMLELDGLVELVHRGYGKKQGRPEILLSLGQKGINLLKDEGVLQSSLNPDPVSCPGTKFMEHQLLLNWVCIHGRGMEDTSRGLITKFSLSNTRYLLCETDRALNLAEKVSTIGEGYVPVSFVPDGVFCIESVQQNKALLFFIEIDMATEMVSSLKEDSNDFHQKIQNYQTYFRTGGYRRYDGWMNHRFKGFRLLVVTNTPSRMEALCRLVQASPPSDFIWLTNESLLLKHGVSDKIWTRGGHQGSPYSSILGPSLAFPCPTLPIKS